MRIFRTKEFIEHEFMQTLIRLKLFEIRGFTPRRGRKPPKR